MPLSPSVKELVPQVFWILEGLNPLDPIAPPTAAPLRNPLSSSPSSRGLALRPSASLPPSNPPLTRSLCRPARPVRTRLTVLSLSGFWSSQWLRMRHISSSRVFVLFRHEEKTPVRFMALLTASQVGPLSSLGFQSSYRGTLPHAASLRILALGYPRHALKPVTGAFRGRSLSAFILPPEQPVTPHTLHMLI